MLQLPLLLLSKPKDLSFRCCCTDIEKQGPGAAGGGLHFGGYPRQRNFHYEFDHTTNRFACYSTKATIILSDMSAVEHGPFACIPGSHKVRLASRFLLHSF